ncbi:MAG: PLD nuclease N-terminal domain-containing protein [Proteobacteria bacterium]|nr:PLD nuclease N-terminal domain-containing protein [Pseudomonadota bacterium]
MGDINFVINHLPLILPLVIVQLTLSVVALIHVLKHPHYRFGNKIMWIIIVLCVNVIGPIFYFVAGRGEDQ